MKTMQKRVLPAAGVLLWGVLANAQAPLEKPLADFDKLVSELKPGNVVGKAIQAGNGAVIPFAAIQFTLGGGGVAAGFAGGMGRRTVPLGILVVEGDDVRAELFPEQAEKPTLVREIMQAILDRKVVVMGNGLNIGGATGSVLELAPLISGMMGQTTVMGNALNLGRLANPAPEAPKNPAAEEKKAVPVPARPARE